MGAVRPLVREDIPQVAALHTRVFRTVDQSLPDTLRANLTQLFCDNPWYDETLPSLVYQDDGRIVGCLGVMPRPMSINGRSIRIAVTHNFMVEPAARSTLAAVQLVKTHLAGLQDATVAATSNDLARKLLETFGGKSALLYSLRWTRLLRPTRYLFSRLAKGAGFAAVAQALRPLSDVVDAVVVRLPVTPFGQVRPRARRADLDAATLRACLADLPRDRALRPEYDDRAVNWLLEILGRKRDGALHKSVVRDAAGGTLGWYLYYRERGGAGEVVQVGAMRKSIGDVLDDLFYDAWRHGLVAVSGQLDPAFMEAFSAKGCLINKGGIRLVVHSKHPDVLEAIYRGEAFLTRLEGAHLAF